MSVDPDATLFRHFIDQVRGQAGSLYGRRLYEIMAYWDVDDPDWSPANREFAQAWRAHRKWVVSNSLTSVGPNATLVQGDIETAVRAIKAEVEGEIEVGGPELARSLGELGLIDMYRIYLHPVVIGGGKPFFVAPRPPLHLVDSERIGGEVILLTYVPA